MAKQARRKAPVKKETPVKQMPQKAPTHYLVPAQTVTALVGALNELLLGKEHTKKVFFDIINGGFQPYDPPATEDAAEK